MRRRYLFGPVPVKFANENLHDVRQAGECLAFNAEGTTDLTVGPGDSWDSIGKRLPPGWTPEFVALYFPYQTIPACFWSASIPLVSWAGDWNLLWHGYRHWLKNCDLVLADAIGVEVMHREGVSQARPARLFNGAKAFLSGHWPGCSRSFLDDAWPAAPRDIDILFVGSAHPAIHRERFPWMARLSRRADRKRVVIRSQAPGPEYRELLARSRIVFNHSLHGECNLRVFEVMASGALLFQEAENRELESYGFRDRLECVLYDPNNLEDLLDFYLDHEEERRRIAEAGRQRILDYVFDRLWTEILCLIDREWDGIVKQTQQRPRIDPRTELVARYWQSISSSSPDPTLIGDLQSAIAAQPESATLHNTLGLAVTLIEQAGRMPTAALATKVAKHFHRAVACDPCHVMARLNLAEALAVASQTKDAAEEARRCLAVLEERQGLDAAVSDAGHFPPSFSYFRVEWEKAGWRHAGDSSVEAQVKRDLIRWRLHTLLATLTGELRHFEEAVLARPDMPNTRAALGCALGRAGKYQQAVEHLRRATADNPFDLEAVRALNAALGLVGDKAGQTQLAQDRRLLAQAAPQLVPAEKWFEQGILVKAKQAVPHVSLCIIVKNEETSLPKCLASAQNLVDEIVVVDTGSTDRTKEVASRLGARVFDFAWTDSFAAARNESLHQATGQWAFWLDGDEWLDEENRRKLKNLIHALPADNIGYVMKQRSPPQPGGRNAIMADQVRLFRLDPAIRWEHRVHEQILPAITRSGGAVRFTDIVIQHDGYDDLATRQRKHERNLRLLEMEVKEKPDDPFVLFNLGWTCEEIGRIAEAVPPLTRSLERCRPADSIMRKVHAVLCKCHHRLGQQSEALSVCRDGLKSFPTDPELLLWEASLLREQKDLRGAETCIRRMLDGHPGEYFAIGVDAGQLKLQARHLLATIYRDLGKSAEAEKHWQAVVREQPDFAAGWLELADLKIGQKRWSELERILEQLESDAGRTYEARLVRARLHLARRDFAKAGELLEKLVSESPQAVLPRLVLSHVLLQSHDWKAAEKVLQEIVALDPSHTASKRNLELLRRQRPVSLT